MSFSCNCRTVNSFRILMCNHSLEAIWHNLSGNERKFRKNLIIWSQGQLSCDRAFFRNFSQNPVNRIFYKNRCKIHNFCWIFVFEHSMEAYWCALSIYEKKLDEKWLIHGEKWTFVRGTHFLKSSTLRKTTTLHKGQGPATCRVDFSKFYYWFIIWKG